MPRYKLTIEYDGTDFVGWQRQDNGRTVQGAIEAAILGFSGETVAVKGAGRTDAGVHALGQVGHVDLARNWPVETVRNAVNAHLIKARDAVAILAVNLVTEEFDARFSALKRHYVYHIVNRAAPLTVLRDRAWRVPRPLDAEAMHEAAQRLVGRHDFTTFRSVQCQAKNPVRTLDRLDVFRNGETIEIHASAQSFLHNQIRSFAGSLKLVGEGRWNADTMTAALEARDRKKCGPVAPPDGLYFSSVDY
ncbi:tRNA pseudouridine(38-40) synthase TruA [Rhizobium sp. EC-SD404]|uniref:tRNA pseudouridine(38-40) synthase TruA n=1 Tax=Rhizobium sp. EC-SD404 TaxID=2038389 RepID=UPI00125F6B00|nr:tRNA pseudouridine(38-40) synthase TruA [Rhizobium sp. EC-SD404]